LDIGGIVRAPKHVICPYCGYLAFDIDGH
jgi:uncharacterized Zn-finger protein